MGLFTDGFKLLKKASEPRNLFSFAIWAAFYLGVLAIEWLIYFIVRRSKK